MTKNVVLLDATLERDEFVCAMPGHGGLSTLPVEQVLDEIARVGTCPRRSTIGVRGNTCAMSPLASQSLSFDSLTWA
jgi:hypothetical protein